jgi:hypothetical protein
VNSDATEGRMMCLRTSLDSNGVRRRSIRVFQMRGARQLYSKLLYQHEHVRRALYRLQQHVHQLEDKKTTLKPKPHADTVYAGLSSKPSKSNARWTDRLYIYIIQS